LQAADQAANGWFRSPLARLITYVLIIVFLLFLFFYGAWISGVVLKEPDICFLLATGRWIVEHGQLPQTDPFSYTTHYLGAPHVLEKWLTEVIFYIIWLRTTAVGLLVFAAAISCLAFIVLPYRIAYLLGARGLSALGLTSLVALNSICHLSVRSEIFSYLFTGAWLEILVRMRAKTSGTNQIDWKSIGLAAVLMVLWSNSHTLFLIGFILLFLYGVCLFLERLAGNLKNSPINYTSAVMLVVCLMASLINPYGVGLWTYMPYVFGGFTATNNEMQPLTLSSLSSMLFYPFVLFTALSLLLLIRRGLKPLQQEGDLFFRLLIPLGIIGGIKTVRTIPISGLLMGSGVASLLKDDTLQKSGFLNFVSTKLDDLVKPMSLHWSLTCVVITLLGAYLMTQIIPPEIPQGSKAFTPPFKAIEYIKKNPPKGNLLNDPHYGAVLMWRMRNNPPVFIDPRYNVSGNDLLQDYWNMVLCRDNWQDLMRKYRIAWVFLPANLELVHRIANDQQWTQLYRDGDSVIYALNSQDKARQKCNSR
jgi:hypothetical protein